MECCSVAVPAPLDALERRRVYLVCSGLFPSRALSLNGQAVRVREPAYYPGMNYRGLAWQPQPLNGVVQSVLVLLGLT